MAIATRAVLRAVPLPSHSSSRRHFFDIVVLPILRSTAVFWVAANYSIQGHKAVGGAFAAVNRAAVGTSGAEAAVARAAALATSVASSSDDSVYRADSDAYGVADRKQPVPAPPTRPRPPPPRQPWLQDSAPP